MLVPINGHSLPETQSIGIMCKPEILVAKDEMLVTLATVSVAILIPGLCNSLTRQVLIWTFSLRRCSLISNDCNYNVRNVRFSLMPSIGRPWAKIQPVIVSFSDGKFRQQPALRHYPDYVCHQCRISMKIIQHANNPLCSSLKLHTNLDDFENNQVSQCTRK